MPQWRGDATGIHAVARRVEAAGYHSIWVNEHIVIPSEVASLYPYREDGRLPFQTAENWTEAMVTLGYLAGITSRVRLGSAVIPVINRDPLSLAKQAATVDIVSGGRLELGIGAGWLLEEAAALGHPTDRRPLRVRETLEILRLAWTGRPFSYSGAAYRIEEVCVAPAPPQGAELPVWIGGTGPSALALAGRQASGLLLSISALPGPERVAELASRLRVKRSEVRLMAPVLIDEVGAAERARELQAAGADLVMAVSHAGVAQAADRLEDFAAAMAAG